MREETEDPTCWITGRGVVDGVPFVLYRTARSRWIIRGVCSCCGECEVGSVNADLVWTGVPVGQPGACLERRFGERKDVPVRPELTRQMPHCSLSGEYR